jgi:hypothetical protein
VAPDADGTPTVRRVVASHLEDGALVMDTGPAYWHEVLQGGTYSLTMPLDGRGDASFRGPGPQAAQLSVAASGLRLPPLEAVFGETDVCQWIHDILDLLPGAKEREVCGKSVSLEVGAGVVVGVKGTLDSLRILNGRVRVTGQTDLSLTVDAGSISGGQPPVFAPCNRGNYLGCMATPTGAALIDFLRRYAPAIPEASLSPVRVCVPGTSVRIRAGYWSGWTWNPAVWEKCRITSIGTLPTITLPSIQAAANEVRPRVDGHLTVRVKGDGEFMLKIAIPSLAAQTSYQVTDDFKAKAAIGVFVLVRASLLNGGGTVRFDFDDTGRVTQTWTSTQGWSRDFALTHKDNHVELLELNHPDSIVVRVGVPVEAKAEACLALWSCGPTEEEGDSKVEYELNVLGKELFTGLNVGVKAGVGVSMFEEAIWTREQVHPGDAEVDNWHISLEGAYDLSVKAGVKIPLTGWILPNVPREFDQTWECCRVSMADYWGQGRIEVTTATTGADPDPDGYRVLVERADTLPSVIDPGATRLGSGWPAKVFDEAVGVDGSVRFGPAGGFLPCIVVYSDAYVVGNPVWGLSVAGARAMGLGIPNYAVTSPCRWLIGRYRVTLTGVAANCTVVGGAVRDSVWLQQRRFIPPMRDDVKQVHFDVQCADADAMGGIRVVLPQGMASTDPPPQLLLDGLVAGTFESDTLVVGELAPGSYEIGVTESMVDCGFGAVQVQVVANQIAEATPPMFCFGSPPPEPGTLRVQSALSGDGNDLNGYALLRDGQLAAALPVAGTAELTGLGALVPTVLAVTDIAGNCQPQAPTPWVVTLDAQATPGTATFPVTCSSAKPDTLTGAVDAYGWPATTVTLRAADGATVSLSGPATGELARLTGTPVRVWGRRSATGLDVYGYDLRSALGDDRWMGIVLLRDDGLWLYGEAAWRLVDPPPGLADASGDLVWVAGQEVDGGLEPTLWGVIREGGS